MPPLVLDPICIYNSPSFPNTIPLTPDICIRAKNNGRVGE